MLELAKILQDIDNLGREQAESRNGLQTELSTADSVMALMGDDMDTTRSKIANAKTSWLTANFDESPLKTYPLPDLPGRHTVLASDGSQIMPDKNEVAMCYLLNASSITIPYGTGERPEAKTYPRLCYREDDLWEDNYDGNRVRMTDKLISVRRTIAEMNALEAAISKASKAETPTVALWDGSLIFWPIQNEPADYRQRTLNEYLRALNEAKEYGIPVAGYISDPGSRDFVNSMKIMLCDQSPIDCDKCKYRADGDTPPCDAVNRVKDSTVYNQRLKSGERSILFTSASKILKDYGDHVIRVFYLNVGREIIRVEIPLWVASDERLLNLTHTVCFDQAQKGRGYPVALSEAHEHAVVKGPERKAFYEMVERAFVKYGARVTRSFKRMSKNY
ncbi:MAG: DNA double-strand break repair nuclease NurA [Armatimonadota bacterium]